VLVARADATAIEHVDPAPVDCRHDDQRQHGSREPDRGDAERCF
jgi:hypothetical protein